MDAWQWLKAKTAPTLFRVLPIDPARERDELHATIRRKLWRHANGSHISKCEAAEMVDLLDEFAERQTPRVHVRPVERSTALEWGRKIDTTRPPCALSSTFLR